MAEREEVGDRTIRIPEYLDATRKKIAKQPICLQAPIFDEEGWRRS